ncbi:MAG: UDP-N-acetylmuramate dehydrogenase [Clostridia bacterium]|nr:UDP-N-acetylmuramate dehydrogenase [Clostridia bacterium]
MENLKKFLKNNNINYIENERLSNHTTFGIGGPCKIMTFPKNIEEIFELCYKLNLENIPYYVIGNGSNLLVKDSGYKGIIIKLGSNFQNIKQEGNKIICQSGLKLYSMHKYLMDNNLTGLEFSFGIPGTVGGATIMNAGAYENCIGNFIDRVYYLKNNRIEIKKKEDLYFGYRISNIDGIVLATKFKLTTGYDVKEKCKRYLLKRKQTQPYNEKSAGSIFKRQNDFIVSKQIDILGLKGYNINGAEISTKHAGFIVNKGGAKCDDVLALIDYIKEQVFRNFGRILELEIKIL